MPLQNRVLPTGEICAIPARGTLTGNRGIIHRGDKTLGTSRWSHHAWICCTLVFFLDEATAFAAGHRPCGYCRRDAYQRYVAAWTKVTGRKPRSPQMDKVLHPARVTRDRRQVRYQAALADLPCGAMIWDNAAPALVYQGALRPFTPDGYGAPIGAVSDTIVTVLTPKPTVAVLQAGYAPQIHPSIAPNR